MYWDFIGYVIATDYIKQTVLATVHTTIIWLITDVSVDAWYNKVMIIYYTDGSASPNPGPGGFAVIKSGQPYIIGGEAGETTNIRMEGKALIAAINDAADNESTIHTDSEFWINVVTKWAPGWAANGWRKKNGEIKNLDIVQELFQTYTNSNAKLVWVRGHVGTELNELADEWANKARMMHLERATLVSDLVI